MQLQRIILFLLLLLPVAVFAQPDDVVWTDIEVKLAEDGYDDCPGCTGGVSFDDGTGSPISTAQGHCHLMYSSGPGEDHPNTTMAQCGAIVASHWGGGQANLDPNTSNCHAEWNGSSGWENGDWNAYECSGTLQSEMNAIAQAGANAWQDISANEPTVDEMVECYIGDGGCTRVDYETQTPIDIDPLTPGQVGQVHTDPNTSQPTVTVNVTNVTNEITNDWSTGGVSTTNATTNYNVGGDVTYGGGGNGTGGDTYNTTNNSTTNNYYESLDCDGENAGTLMCADTEGDAFVDQEGTDVTSSGFMGELQGTELFQALDGLAGAIDTSGGECPELSIDLSGTLIGEVVSTNLHCDLAIAAMPVFQPIMLLIFAIMGINIIFRV